MTDFTISRLRIKLPSFKISGFSNETPCFERIVACASRSLTTSALSRLNGVAISSAAYICKKALFEFVRVSTRSAFDGVNASSDSTSRRPAVRERERVSDLRASRLTSVQLTEAAIVSCSKLDSLTCLRSSVVEHGSAPHGNARKRSRWRSEKSGHL